MSTKKFTQLTLGRTKTLKTGKDIAQKIKIKVRENIERENSFPATIERRGKGMWANVTAPTVNKHVEREHAWTLATTDEKTDKKKPTRKNQRPEKPDLS